MLFSSPLTSRWIEYYPKKIGCFTAELARSYRQERKKRLEKEEQERKLKEDKEKEQEQKQLEEEQRIREEKVSPFLNSKFLH